MNARDVDSAAWYGDLKKEIEQELAARRHQEPELAGQLESRRTKLEAQIQGWALSLGNQNLPHAVRTTLESSIAGAFEQIREIDAQLSELRLRTSTAARVLDSQVVAERLNRLPELLASGNPVLVNLELSQHIDRIVCFPDGKVSVRLSRLGALAGAVPLLESDHSGCDASHDVASGVVPTRPKRRARAAVVTGARPREDLQATVEWATDPHRFAGLDERWFETCEFQIPLRTSWAEQSALDVARYRLEHRATLEQLSAHFQKSIPTIRKALAFARDQGLDASETMLRLPRGRQWARQNMTRVAEYLNSTGSTLRAAARHFGVSEPTIRKALRLSRAETIAVSRVAEPEEQPPQSTRTTCGP